MQVEGWAETPADMTKLTAGIRKFEKVLKNVTKHHCIEWICKNSTIMHLFVFR